MKRTFFFILLLSLNACIQKTDDTENIKAKWIRRTFETLTNESFPRIRAVSWWQEKWENEDGSISDLRINSSAESLSEFQKDIRDPHFVSVPEFDNDKLIPHTGCIYFGAFPDFGGPEDQVSAQRIFDFENLALKPIAWAYFSDNWYNNIHFPADAVQSIHQAGRVPFIRMMARSGLEEGVADPVYDMQSIIDGDFDSDLLQWFQDASQTGFPMLIEFGTEANGEWFPWNGTYNGGAVTNAYGDPGLPDGPERFRDAYRHIIDLSRQAGAYNLTWFFHLDAAGYPEESWNDFENYYPGDDYIDWVGFSVYGAVTPDDDFHGFYEKLSPVYQRITEMTQRPLAVLETGLVEDINLLSE